MTTSTSTQIQHRPVSTSQLQSGQTTIENSNNPFFTSPLTSFQDGAQLSAAQGGIEDVVLRNKLLNYIDSLISEKGTSSEFIAVKTFILNGMQSLKTSEDHISVRQFLNLVTDPSISNELNISATQLYQLNHLEKLCKKCTVPASYTTAKSIRQSVINDLGMTKTELKFRRNAQLINPDHPAFKGILSTIFTNSPAGLSDSEIAEKVLNYVQDNFSYQSDVGADTWQSIDDTLLKGGGDCEDLSVLTSSLLMSALGQAGHSKSAVRDIVTLSAGYVNNDIGHVLVKLKTDSGTLLLDSTGKVPILKEGDLQFDEVFEMNDEDFVKYQEITASFATAAGLTSADIVGRFYQTNQDGSATMTDRATFTDPTATFNASTNIIDQINHLVVNLENQINKARDIPFIRQGDNAQDTLLYRKFVDSTGSLNPGSVRDITTAYNNAIANAAPGSGGTTTFYNELNGKMHKFSINGGNRDEFVLLAEKNAFLKGGTKASLEGNYDNNFRLYFVDDGNNGYRQLKDQAEFNALGAGDTIFRRLNVYTAIDLDSMSTNHYNDTLLDPVTQSTNHIEKFDFYTVKKVKLTLGTGRGEFGMHVVDFDDVAMENYMTEVLEGINHITLLMQSSLLLLEKMIIQAVEIDDPDQNEKNKRTTILDDPAYKSFTKSAEKWQSKISSSVQQVSDRIFEFINATNDMEAQRVGFAIDMWPRNPTTQGGVDGGEILGNVMLGLLSNLVDDWTGVIAYEKAGAKFDLAKLKTAVTARNASLRLDITRRLMANRLTIEDIETDVQELKRYDHFYYDYGKRPGSTSANTMMQTMESLDAQTAKNEMQQGRVTRGYLTNAIGGLNGEIESVIKLIKNSGNSSSDINIGNLTYASDHFGGIYNGLAREEGVQNTNTSLKNAAFINMAPEQKNAPPSAQPTVTAPPQQAVNLNTDLEVEALKVERVAVEALITQGVANGLVAANMIVEQAELTRINGEIYDLLDIPDAEAQINDLTIRQQALVNGAPESYPGELNALNTTITDLQAGLASLKARAAAPPNPSAGANAAQIAADSAAAQASVDAAVPDFATPAPMGGSDRSFLDFNTPRKLDLQMSITQYTNFLKTAVNLRMVLLRATYDVAKELGSYGSSPSSGNLEKIVNQSMDAELGLQSSYMQASLDESTKIVSAANELIKSRFVLWNKDAEMTIKTTKTAAYVVVEAAAIIFGLGLTPVSTIMGLTPEHFAYAMNTTGTATVDAAASAALAGVNSVTANKEYYRPQVTQAARNDFNFAGAQSQQNTLEFDFNQQGINTQELFDRTEKKVSETGNNQMRDYFQKDLQAQLLQGRKLFGKAADNRTFYNGSKSYKDSTTEFVTSRGDGYYTKDSYAAFLRSGPGSFNDSALSDTSLINGIGDFNQDPLWKEFAAIKIRLVALQMLWDAIFEVAKNITDTPSKHAANYNQLTGQIKAYISLEENVARSLLAESDVIIQAANESAEREKQEIESIALSANNAAKAIGSLMTSIPGEPSNRVAYFAFVQTLEQTDLLRRKVVGPYAGMSAVYRNPDNATNLKILGGGGANTGHPDSPYSAALTNPDALDLTQFEIPFDTNNDGKIGANETSIDRTSLLTAFTSELESIDTTSDLNRFIPYGDTELTGFTQMQKYDASERELLNNFYTESQNNPRRISSAMPMTSVDFQLVINTKQDMTGVAMGRSLMMTIMNSYSVQRNNVLREMFGTASSSSPFQKSMDVVESYNTAQDQAFDTLVQEFKSRSEANNVYQGELIGYTSELAISTAALTAFILSYKSPADPNAPGGETKKSNWLKQQLVIGVVRAIAQFVSAMTLAIIALTTERNTPLAPNNFTIGGEETEEEKQERLDEEAANKTDKARVSDLKQKKNSGKPLSDAEQDELDGLETGIQNRNDRMEARQKTISERGSQSADNETTDYGMNSGSIRFTGAGTTVNTAIKSRAQLQINRKSRQMQIMLESKAQLLEEMQKTSTSVTGLEGTNATAGATGLLNVAKRAQMSAVESIFAAVQALAQVRGDALERIVTAFVQIFSQFIKAAVSTKQDKIKEKKAAAKTKRLSKLQGKTTGELKAAHTKAKTEKQKAKTAVKKQKKEVARASAAVKTAKNDKAKIKKEKKLKGAKKKLIRLEQTEKQKSKAVTSAKKDARLMEGVDKKAATQKIATYKAVRNTANATKKSIAAQAALDNESDPIKRIKLQKQANAANKNEQKAIQAEKAAMDKGNALTDIQINKKFVSANAIAAEAVKSYSQDNSELSSTAYFLKGVDYLSGIISLTLAQSFTSVTVASMAEASGETEAGDNAQELSSFYVEGNVENIIESLTDEDSFQDSGRFETGDIENAILAAQFASGNFKSLAKNMAAQNRLLKLLSTYVRDATKYAVKRVAGVTDSQQEKRKEKLEEDTAIAAIAAKEEIIRRGGDPATLSLNDIARHYKGEKIFGFNPITLAKFATKHNTRAGRIGLGIKSFLFGNGKRLEDVDEDAKEDRDNSSWKRTPLWLRKVGLRVKRNGLFGSIPLLNGRLNFFGLNSGFELSYRKFRMTNMLMAVRMSNSEQKQKFSERTDALKQSINIDDFINSGGKAIARRRNNLVNLARSADSKSPKIAQRTMDDAQGNLEWLSNSYLLSIRQNMVKAQGQTSLTLTTKSVASLFSNIDTLTALNGVKQVFSSQKVAKQGDVGDDLRFAPKSQDELKAIIKVLIDEKKNKTPEQIKKLETLAANIKAHFETSTSGSMTLEISQEMNALSSDLDALYKMGKFDASSLNVFLKSRLGDKVNIDTIKKISTSLIKGLEKAKFIHDKGSHFKFKDAFFNRREGLEEDAADPLNAIITGALTRLTEDDNKTAATDAINRLVNQIAGSSSAFKNASAAATKIQLTSQDLVDDISRDLAKNSSPELDKLFQDFKQQSDELKERLVEEDKKRRKQIAEKLTAPVTVSNDVRILSIKNTEGNFDASLSTIEAMQADSRTILIPVQNGKEIIYVSVSLSNIGSSDDILNAVKAHLNEDPKTKIHFLGKSSDKDDSGIKLTAENFNTIEGIADNKAQEILSKLSSEKIIDKEGNFIIGNSGAISTIEFAEDPVINTAIQKRVKELALMAVQGQGFLNFFDKFATQQTKRQNLISQLSQVTALSNVLMKDGAASKLAALDTDLAIFDFFSRNNLAGNAKDEFRQLLEKANRNSKANENSIDPNLPSVDDQLESLKEKDILHEDGSLSQSALYDKFDASALPSSITDILSPKVIEKIIERQKEKQHRLDDIQKRGGLVKTSYNRMQKLQRSGDDIFKTIENIPQSIMDEMPGLKEVRDGIQNLKSSIDNADTERKEKAKQRLEYYVSIFERTPIYSVADAQRKANRGFSVFGTGLGNALGTALGAAASLFPGSGLVTAPIGYLGEKVSSAIDKTGFNEFRNSDWATNLSYSLTGNRTPDEIRTVQTAKRQEALGITGSRMIEAFQSFNLLSQKSEASSITTDISNAFKKKEFGSIDDFEFGQTELKEAADAAYRIGHLMIEEGRSAEEGASFFMDMAKSVVSHTKNAEYATRFAALTLRLINKELGDEGKELLSALPTLFAKGDDRSFGTNILSKFISTDTDFLGDVKDYAANKNLQRMPIFGNMFRNGMAVNPADKAAEMKAVRGLGSAREESDAAKAALLASDNFSLFISSAQTKDQIKNPELLTFLSSEEDLGLVLDRVSEDLMSDDIRKAQATDALRNLIMLTGGSGLLLEVIESAFITNPDVLKTAIQAIDNDQQFLSDQVTNLASLSPDAFKAAGQGRLFKESAQSSSYEKIEKNLIDFITQTELNGNAVLSSLQEEENLSSLVNVIQNAVKLHSGHGAALAKKALSALDSAINTSRKGISDTDISKRDKSSTDNISINTIARVLNTVIKESGSKILTGPKDSKPFALITKEANVSPEVAAYEADLIKNVTLLSENVENSRALDEFLSTDQGEDNLAQLLRLDDPSQPLSDLAQAAAAALATKAATSDPSSKLRLVGQRIIRVVTDELAKTQDKAILRQHLALFSSNLVKNVDEFNVNLAENKQIALKKTLNEILTISNPDSTEVKNFLMQAKFMQTPDAAMNFRLDTDGLWTGSQLFKNELLAKDPAQLKDMYKRLASDPDKRTQAAALIYTTLLVPPNGVETDIPQVQALATSITEGITELSTPEEIQNAVDFMRFLSGSLGEILDGNSTMAKSSFDLLDANKAGSSETVKEAMRKIVEDMQDQTVVLSRMSGKARRYTTPKATSPGGRLSQATFQALSFGLTQTSEETSKKLKEAVKQSTKDLALPVEVSAVSTFNKNLTTVLNIITKKKDTLSQTELKELEKELEKLEEEFKQLEEEFKQTLPHLSVSEQQHVSLLLLTAKATQYSGTTSDLYSKEAAAELMTGQTEKMSAQQVLLMLNLTPASKDKNGKDIAKDIRLEMFIEMFKTAPLDADFMARAKVIGAFEAKNSTERDNLHSISNIILNRLASSFNGQITDRDIIKDIGSRDEVIQSILTKEAVYLSKTTSYSDKDATQDAAIATFITHIANAQHSGVKVKLDKASQSVLSLFLTAHAGTVSHPAQASKLLDLSRTIKNEKSLEGLLTKVNPVLDTLPSKVKNAFEKLDSALTVQQDRSKLLTDLKNKTPEEISEETNKKDLEALLSDGREMANIRSSDPALYVKLLKVAINDKVTLEGRLSEDKIALKDKTPLGEVAEHATYEEFEKFENAKGSELSDVRRAFLELPESKNKIRLYEMMRLNQKQFKAVFEPSTKPLSTDYNFSGINPNISGQDIQELLTTPSTTSATGERQILFDASGVLQPGILNDTGRVRAEFLNLDGSINEKRLKDNLSHQILRSRLVSPHYIPQVDSEKIVTQIVNAHSTEQKYRTDLRKFQKQIISSTHISGASQQQLLKELHNNIQKSHARDRNGFSELKRETQATLKAYNANDTDKVQTHVKRAMATLQSMIPELLVIGVDIKVLKELETNLSLGQTDGNKLFKLTEALNKLDKKDEKSALSEADQKVLSQARADISTVILQRLVKEKSFRTAHKKDIPDFLKSLGTLGEKIIMDADTKVRGKGNPVHTLMQSGTFTNADMKTFMTLFDEIPEKSKRDNLYESLLEGSGIFNPKDEAQMAMLIDMMNEYSGGAGKVMEYVSDSKTQGKVLELLMQQGTVLKDTGEFDASGQPIMKEAPRIDYTDVDSIFENLTQIDEGLAALTATSNAITEDTTSENGKIQKGNNIFPHFKLLNDILNPDNPITDRQEILQHIASRLESNSTLFLAFIDRVESAKHTSPALNINMKHIKNPALIEKPSLSVNLTTTEPSKSEKMKKVNQFQRLLDSSTDQGVQLLNDALQEISVTAPIGDEPPLVIDIIQASIGLPQYRAAILGLIGSKEGKGNKTASIMKEIIFKDTESKWLNAKSLEIIVQNSGTHFQRSILYDKERMGTFLEKADQTLRPDLVYIAIKDRLTRPNSFKVPRQLSEKQVVYALERSIQEGTADVFKSVLTGPRYQDFVTNHLKKVLEKSSSTAVIKPKQIVSFLNQLDNSNITKKVLSGAFIKRIDKASESGKKKVEELPSDKQIPELDKASILETEMTKELQSFFSETIGDPNFMSQMTPRKRELFLTDIFNSLMKNVYPNNQTALSNSLNALMTNNKQNGKARVSKQAFETHESEISEVDSKNIYEHLRMRGVIDPDGFLTPAYNADVNLLDVLPNGDLKADKSKMSVRSAHVNDILASLDLSRQRPLPHPIDGLINAELIKTGKVENLNANDIFKSLSQIKEPLTTYPLLGKIIANEFRNPSMRKEFAEFISKPDMLQHSKELLQITNLRDQIKTEDTDKELSVSDPLMYSLLTNTELSQDNAVLKTYLDKINAKPENKIREKQMEKLKELEKQKITTMGTSAARTLSLQDKIHDDNARHEFMLDLANADADKFDLLFKELGSTYAAGLENLEILFANVNSVSQSKLQQQIVTHMAIKFKQKPPTKVNEALDQFAWLSKHGNAYQITPAALLKSQKKDTPSDTLEIGIQAAETLVNSLISMDVLDKNGNVNIVLTTEKTREIEAQLKAEHVDSATITHVLEVLSSSINSPFATQSRAMIAAIEPTLNANRDKVIQYGHAIFTNTHTDQSGKKIDLSSAERERRLQPIIKFMQSEKDTKTRFNRLYKWAVRKNQQWESISYAPVQHKRDPLHKRPSFQDIEILQTLHKDIKTDEDRAVFVNLLATSMQTHGRLYVKRHKHTMDLPAKLLQKVILKDIREHNGRLVNMLRERIQPEKMGKSEVPLKALDEILKDQWQFSVTADQGDIDKAIRHKQGKKLMGRDAVVASYKSSINAVISKPNFKPSELDGILAKLPEMGLQQEDISWIHEMTLERSTFSTADLDATIAKAKLPVKTAVPTAKILDRLIKADNAFIKVLDTGELVRSAKKIKSTDDLKLDDLLFDLDPSEQEKVKEQLLIRLKQPHDLMESLLRVSDKDLSEFKGTGRSGRKHHLYPLIFNNRALYVDDITSKSYFSRKYDAVVGNPKKPGKISSGDEFYKERNTMDTFMKERGGSAGTHIMQMTARFLDNGEFKNIDEMDHFGNGLLTSPAIDVAEKLMRQRPSVQAKHLETLPEIDAEFAKAKDKGLLPKNATLTTFTDTIKDTLIKAEILDENGAVSAEYIKNPDKALSTLPDALAPYKDSLKPMLSTINESSHDFETYQSNVWTSLISANAASHLEQLDKDSDKKNGLKYSSRAFMHKSRDFKKTYKAANVALVLMHKAAQIESDILREKLNPSIKDPGKLAKLQAKQKTVKGNLLALHQHSRAIFNYVLNSESEKNMFREKTLLSPKEKTSVCNLLFGKHSSAGGDVMADIEGMQDQLMIEAQKERISEISRTPEKRRFADKMLEHVKSDPNTNKAQAFNLMAAATLQVGNRIEFKDLSGSLNDGIISAAEQACTPNVFDYLVVELDAKTPEARGQVRDAIQLLKLDEKVEGLDAANKILEKTNADKGKQKTEVFSRIIQDALKENPGANKIKIGSGLSLAAKKAGFTDVKSFLEKKLNATTDKEKGQIQSATYLLTFDESILKLQDKATMNKLFQNLAGKHSFDSDTMKTLFENDAAVLAATPEDRPGIIEGKIKEMKTKMEEKELLRQESQEFYTLFNSVDKWQEMLNALTGEDKELIKAEHINKMKEMYEDQMKANQAAIKQISAFAQADIKKGNPPAKMNTFVSNFLKDATGEIPEANTVKNVTQNVLLDVFLTAEVSTSKNAFEELMKYYEPDGVDGVDGILELGKHLSTEDKKQLETRLRELSGISTVSSDMLFDEDTEVHAAVKNVFDSQRLSEDKGSFHDFIQNLEIAARTQKKFEVPK